MLLHGCGQEAARFAAAAGWMALADRLGAPLLLPEQAGRNNQGRCFNWFEPDDIARGTGEAASIRAMAEAAIDRLGCDRKRVFLAGLSAGGAMAAAVLAAYPEVFAAGAVVAGLPVGGASDVRSAMACMAGAGDELDGPGWADRARALAPPGYDGSWPRLAIWQGLADPVVDPANAGKLRAQWGTLHGRVGALPRTCRPPPGCADGPGAMPSRSGPSRAWRAADFRWAIQPRAIRARCRHRRHLRDRPLLEAVAGLQNKITSDRRSDLALTLCLRA